MTRAAFLLQMLMMGEASEGFVSLFNGQELGQWVGDQQQWKVERAVITGRCDGKTGSALVLGGREYGDFDLRFDLRVKRGAGGVQMRGPGRGPVGTGLEVGTSVVQWMVNGSPSGVVANVKPGEWNAYRIVAKGSGFQVFHNEREAATRTVVGHMPPRGKLSLTLPAGAPSEIEFRNIRIKE